MFSSYSRFVLRLCFYLSIVVGVDPVAAVTAAIELLVPAVAVLFHTAAPAMLPMGPDPITVRQIRTPPATVQDAEDSVTSARASPESMMTNSRPDHPSNKCLMNLHSK